VFGSASIQVVSDKVKILSANDISVIIQTDCNIKIKHTKNVQIIKRLTKNIKPITVDAWANKISAEVSKQKLTLYKRVSKDFLTQEGTSNETRWKIGKIVEHKNWKPAESECGSGKFHGCVSPIDCDLFRGKEGDKYIVVSVLKNDCYAWPKNPEYPMKIGFRKGKVLYECDKNGKKI
jgi:hypothetical protein